MLLATDSQRIAEHLCSTTEEVLWDHISSWAKKRSQQLQFATRVGSGKATYLRRREGGYLITYGRKMVQSKRCRRSATTWATAQEIVARGYFGGVLEYGSLLAHTACHEVAHVVQDLNGWISQNSIHNQNFYQILDRLHASDIAARVLAELVSKCSASGIDLMWQDDPSSLEYCPPQVGQRVSFIRRDGAAVAGVIKRVNRQTVTVVPDRGRKGLQYRVPPALLTF